MNRDMHLSLIGFMGSGKTTVGQAMATRLGRPFLDIDAQVERMLGMPIPQVFAELGEPAFREAEQDALSDALRPNEPIVLSTGEEPLARMGPWSGCVAGRWWWPWHPHSRCCCHGWSLRWTSVPC